MKKQIELLKKNTTIKVYRDYFINQNMIKECIIPKSVIVLLIQKKN